MLVYLLDVMPSTNLLFFSLEIVLTFDIQTYLSLSKPKEVLTGQRGKYEESLKSEFDRKLSVLLHLYAFLTHPTKDSRDKAWTYYHRYKERREQEIKRSKQ